MTDPLRALFVNEGALGPGVMGHTRAGDIVERRLGHHDVQARFAGLPPLGGVARAAMRGVPPLAEFDLDLHAVRWHLVQAARARAVIARELRDAPADVMHVHTHTLALLLSGQQMRRVPTLLAVDATAWQWHAMGIWRAPRAHSRTLLAPSLALERRALSAAAAVLTFSRWGRHGVEAEAPDANVLEHHPGIDVQRFAPAPRRPRRRPRVLFVGGRFAQKGGDDLLAALAPHIGAELDVDLVTPADVPAREGVRVHHLGHDDPGLLALFQQADVFCLPSRGDAVPFAVLEAMACGTPVVATAIGGIPDQLDDGRAGRLVPVGDRRALADAVLGLLRDEAARGAIAAAARRRCEQHFDAVRQTAKLVEIMREVARPRELSHA